MKLLIQRVSHASVEVKSETLGTIGQGILAFVGIEKHDTPELLFKMANRLLAYRVFPDAEGKMNLSLKETYGELLVISQFTLAADTRKGLRPSFSSAAVPEQAQALFDQFVNYLKKVQIGRAHV